MPTAARIQTPTQPLALPRGFEALYCDHYDFVWRCALRLGASSTDVEDIVQETFIVALRRYDVDGFAPGRARPSTWLFAILHNVLRNHARSERRRRARHDVLAESEVLQPTPGMPAESSLALRLLDEFLRELDDDLRIVFVLAELEGMRGPEIAKAIGLNPNTVRSRLRSARQAFAARFTNDRERVVSEAANEAAPSDARVRTMALLCMPREPWITVGASGWWGWASGVRGLLALVIGSVAIVGVAVVVDASTPAKQAEPSRPPASARASPVETIAAVSPIPASEPDDTRAIVIEARSEPRRATRPKATTKPRPRTNTEALDVLERAREAALAGDAAAALALVEGREGWPPVLDARRVALEIGALCTLGRSQQARARAQAWSEAHPDTSTAVSLRALCWDDANIER